MTSGWNSMKSFGSIFSQQAKSAEKKKKVPKATMQVEAEMVQDPQFKKIQALKKILNKFSDKTFTLHQNNNQIDY